MLEAVTQSHQSSDGASFSAPPFQWETRHFSPVSPVAYSAIQQFLVFESLLLDNRRYTDWLRLISHNVVYRIQVSADTDHSLEGLGEHIHCDYCKIADRVSALTRPEKASACNGVQTRRFVSNVSVFCQRSNDYEVGSYLRVDHILDHGRTTLSWTGQRRDRIRAGGGNFYILKRELLIDTVTPGICRLPDIA